MTHEREGVDRRMRGGGSACVLLVYHDSLSVSMRGLHLLLGSRPVSVFRWDIVSVLLSPTEEYLRVLFTPVSHSFFFRGFSLPCVGFVSIFGP